MNIDNYCMFFSVPFTGRDDALFLLTIKFLKLLVIQLDMHGLRSCNCVNSHH